MRENRPPKGKIRRFNKREEMFSKYGKREDRRPGRLELFDVVCAKCGKDTQVPFKPSSNKPVYCRDCFQKDGDGPRRDAPRRDYRDGGQRRDYRESGPSGDSSDTLSQINRKLDKIMRALEIE
jgi:CxxC-x17-CxxC domain-containing protein